MEFSLPGPIELEFRPGRGWCLEARVADPRGYLAQAGLLSGDLIVAIEGGEFRNADEIQRALAVLGK